MHSFPTSAVASHLLSSLTVVHVISLHYMKIKGLNLFHDTAPFYTPWKHHGERH